MENISLYLPKYQLFLMALFAIFLLLLFRISDAYFVPLFQKKQPKSRLYWFRIKTIIWTLYFLLFFSLLFSVNMLLTLTVSAIAVVVGWSFWTNLFAGILIRFTQQFKVGDQIKTDFGSGQITGIHSTYTELRDENREMLLIPNIQLKNTVVKQMSIRQSPNIDKFSCSGNFSYDQVYLHAINCPYLTANQKISIEKTTNNTFEIRAMLLDQSFREKAVAYFEQVGNSAGFKK